MTEENPAKQFEEAIHGNLSVTSALRKQYLESARGHYLSALAGLTAEKQEHMRIGHSVDSFPELDDSALEQAAEAEPICIQRQLGLAKTFAEMDIQIHLRNGVLETSDMKLHPMKVQLNRTIAKNSKEQIAEMISRIGAFGQEIETVDASELQAGMTVLPELGGAKESLLKGVVEGNSLHKMVKSLKAELENLKKEHAELQDKDTGVEFASRNLHFKLQESKSEQEGCLANESKVGQTFEELPWIQHELEDLKITDKGLKREHETSKFSVETDKRPRIALYADEAKEAIVSSLDQNKNLAGKTYDACVSTSESSARIMVSEDEHESSSQKAVKSDMLERGKVESDKYDNAAEFSIRDFVFAARNKDISTNWPFSQRNLQLCLKHGVKNVLPPFQPLDSLKDNSMKRCSTETSLHSEESNLDARPSVLNNHIIAGSALDRRWNQELTEGYRDSDSLPSIGEKDFAFKSIATANSQSEVESVSTSNLPFSEVSDEQGAAASAANRKTKSSISQLSNNKKCRTSVKVRISNYRGAADDTTSACTAPSEAIASKICPVCQTFSSSSNTTLNAHIDQCLSSQSTPNWFNSKLIRPRIKPRKMRLMADICATAPRCTLEDLDRRNGTNWATNADVPCQDTDVSNQGKNSRGLSKYVVNNGGDGAVYIDSNGTKIRILSKSNDITSSPSPKARKDLRPKRKSKKGKMNKFFSPDRKRRLAKHLKYLKVTRQRKRLSSLKVKCRPIDVCGAEEATCTGGEKHIKEQHPVPSVKAPEQKYAGVSGNSRQWLASLRSNLSKKNESEDVSKACRHKLRANQNLQPESNQLDNGEIDVRKKTGSPTKSLPSRVRSSNLHGAGPDQKSRCLRGRNTFCGPSKRDGQRVNRDSALVPLKPGVGQPDGENTKEVVPKLVDSKVTQTPASSMEREDEIQADAVDNADSFLPGGKELSDSSYVFPLGKMRSHSSETSMLSQSLPYVWRSNSKQKSSAVEKGDIWSADVGWQSISTPEHPERSEISNPRGHISLIEVQRKRVSEDDEDGSRDSDRFGGIPDECQENHGCVKSAVTGLQNNGEVVAPVISSSLAIRETVTSSSRLSDSEFRASHPQPKYLHCSDKFEGPLFRTEARVHSGQPSLGDEHETYYGDVVGTVGIKSGGSDFNVERESSFPEVDPIPIPGPPGSDLPSFSDMGSEDLHRSSSLSSSLAQSSGDGDDVDGDLSDSPLSATSTISNLGVVDDHTGAEQECLTRRVSVSNTVYPGWSGASSVPMLGTSTMLSQLAAGGTNSVATLVDNSKESVLVEGKAPLIPNGDNQQCCCSRKEGIPWSSALNFEESHLLGQRIEPLATSLAAKQTVSALNGRQNCNRNEVFSFSSYSRGESQNFAHSIGASYQSIMPLEITTEAAVSFPRAVCDSASPAPILRLMGKDLMVINKEKDDTSRDKAVQNVSTNRQVLPTSEFSAGGTRSWHHQPPHGTVFIGPPVHEQGSLNIPQSINPNFIMRLI